jgi:pyridoxine 5-phosphate synthase
LIQANPEFLRTRKNEMTLFSVNLNKIALLRNSRGRDFPNVVEFARTYINLGVRGLTIHPRQDERHITRQDTRDLAELVVELDSVELNIEGYPSEDFMQLVEAVKPDQCTLVPDSPDQLTSDHGWDLDQTFDQVSKVCARINQSGVRSAIFLYPERHQVELAAKTGTRRLELYTEAYAESYGKENADEVFEQYKSAAELARKLGLELNAGHDLDLSNLAKFLTIDGILEVSIGHAFTVECIERGMKPVVADYLKTCKGG